MNPTKLLAYVNGIPYDIDDDEYMVHEGNSGFGMVPVKRLRQKAPMQDGETDLGVVLQKRTVDLYLYALADTWAKHFTRRNTLLTIFRPSDDPVILEWQLANGDKRRLDCYFVGEMLFNSHDFKGSNFPTVIRLEAPNPLFYDPTLKNLTAILEGSGSFEFPFTFPATFYSSLISKGATVTNAGTWRAFPIIEITGPGTNPVIENASTGKQISLTYAISGGEIVTIDLTPGAKTITNDSGDDLFGTLDTDSDLADFALEPDPEVDGGQNSLKLTITSGTPGTTQMAVKWHDRFVGV